MTAIETTTTRTVALPRTAASAPAAAARLARRGLLAGRLRLSPWVMAFSALPTPLYVLVRAA